MLFRSAVSGKSNVSVTGVAATGYVGTVSIIQGVGVHVHITGVAAANDEGSVSVIGKANVYPLSAVGYGLVGYPLVWGLIDNTQDADWVLVNNTQDADWVLVNNTQDANWVKIAA